MSDTQDLERLKILYSEASKFALTFIDWREKVMSRFFTVQAGCIAIAGWFYQQPYLRCWTFIPFTLSALFAVFSVLLDRVNTKLLQECRYPVGKKLEGSTHEGGGVLTAIHDSNRLLSYRVALRIMYLAGATLSVALALASAVLTYQGRP